MHTKLKGDVGELIVAEDAMQKGWMVSFPFGENARYDLIIEKAGEMKRLQVKAVFPRNGVLHVNCRSSNNWSVVSYTKKDFEVIAAVDLSTKLVYYIPVEKIGRNLLNIRLVKAQNNQIKNIRSCKEFLTI